jgi:membrane-associated phospholipid phosphatase
MMKKLVTFWKQNISSQISSLIASIGVTSLVLYLVILLTLRWLFEEVWEKETFSFDKTLLLGIRQWANPVLDSLMLKITHLGDPGFIVGVVLASLIWLWWKQCYFQAKMFAFACLGALILNQGLKLLFAKARPVLWQQLITETSFSFPSGHALGSIVIYGFLAYFLATQLPRFSRWIYVASIGVIAAIGFSRLYLGVHWPTDVLAGYAVGFLWLMTSITLLKMQTQKSA